MSTKNCGWVVTICERRNNKSNVKKVNTQEVIVPEKPKTRSDGSVIEDTRNQHQKIFEQKYHDAIKEFLATDDVKVSVQKTKLKDGRGKTEKKFQKIINPKIKLRKIHKPRESKGEKLSEGVKQHKRGLFYCKTCGQFAGAGHRVEHQKLVHNIEMNPKSLSEYFTNEPIFPKQIENIEESSVEEIIQQGCS